MATRLRIPVKAYILTLYPKSSGASSTSSLDQRRKLQALASGLALPSFWTRGEITQTFAEANRIWIREADIEFAPIEISERDEVVPADENDMWIYFVNHLSPGGHAVGVAFVYDLPSDEAGWGGGHIAALSGNKAGWGSPQFAGNLLAHELGHMLMDDPTHALAGKQTSNLMYGARNSGVVNAGVLNERQVNIARSRVLSL